jgi:6-phosphogluconolactonase
MQKRKKGAILVYSNAETLGLSAARIFAESAGAAVEARDRFVVALSGGSSPATLYRTLAEIPWSESVPWDRTHVFWGDERCVPEDDPRSNALMAFELLLSHVPVPRDQIHPISCYRSPADAAAVYEALITDLFGPNTPAFDLILLGLGENGHTASLFPGDPILDEKKRLAKELYLPDQDIFRVSLTAPLINRARKIMFLVFGSKKAHVLHEVLEGPYEPRRLPAQLIQPDDGELMWLVDEEAAGELKERGKKATG